MKSSALGKSNTRSTTLAVTVTYQAATTKTDPRKVMSTKVFWGPWPDFNRTLLYNSSQLPSLLSRKKAHNAPASSRKCSNSNRYGLKTNARTAM